MMQSEQTNELANALCKAQSAMKAAILNKTNPHFKNRYADLTAVIDAIREPLSSNGLSITQAIHSDPDRLVLVTTLHHSSGQFVQSEYPLPIGVTPQQLGSALTYARRYSLSCIACISADEDDDAQEASKSITQDQVGELIALIEDVGADQIKFTHYLKVSKLSELPATRYKEAIAALEAKRKAA